MMQYFVIDTKLLDPTIETRIDQIIYHMVLKPNGYIPMGYKVKYIYTYDILLKYIGENTSFDARVHINRVQFNNTKRANIISYYYYDTLNDLYINKHQFKVEHILTEIG